MSRWPSNMIGWAEPVPRQTALRALPLVVDGRISASAPGLQTPRQETRRGSIATYRMSRTPFRPELAGVPAALMSAV